MLFLLIWILTRKLLGMKLRQLLLHVKSYDTERVFISVVFHSFLYFIKVIHFITQMSHEGYFWPHDCLLGAVLGESVLRAVCSQCPCLLPSGVLSSAQWGTVFCPVGYW